MASPWALHQRQIQPRRTGAGLPKPNAWRRIARSRARLERTSVRRMKRQMRKEAQP